MLGEENGHHKNCDFSATTFKGKMFEHRYPDIPLLWVCYSKIDGGWIDYDELQKARAKRKKEKKNERGGINA